MVSMGRSLVVFHGAGRSLMNEMSIEQMRSWVIALLIRCPFGKLLDDCPAKGIRGLPRHALIGAAGEMDEKQINGIIAHHKECLRTREAS